VGGFFFDKQNRTRNPGQRRLAQFAHSLSRRQQGQPQTNVRLAYSPKMRFCVFVVCGATKTR
jgi:hypothetical protein